MRTIKFLSQKGMTLTEIMVAAALMGGVALITAKLMGDQTNNQAHITAKADVNSVVTKIESLLTNPEKCTLMLKDKVVSAAGTSVGAGGLSFIIPPDGPNPAKTVNVINVGKYKSFEILAGGIRLQSSIYGASVTDVVIDFTMKGKTFTYGADQKRVYTKKIPIVTQLDEATKTIIEGCGPVLGDANIMGQKKLCDAMGGVASWDASAGVEGECVLQEAKCPWGSVATKLTSLGGIICTPLKDQVKLDEVFNMAGKDCTGLTRIQIINDGAGKLKVNCY